MSFLSEPKISEENLLWGFYSGGTEGSTCTIILLLPALSAEWYLIQTVSNSLHIYSMHKKGCFKQKKTVCGVFGVCFQPVSNEFQKIGRRTGESHRTKPGKGREKGKRATSGVNRVSGQGAATAAESRIHDILFWS